MRKYAKFPIAHILDWKISIKDFFILTKSTDFDLAQKQLKKVDSFVEKRYWFCLLIGCSYVLILNKNPREKSNILQKFICGNFVLELSHLMFFVCIRIRY